MIYCWSSAGFVLLFSHVEIRFDVWVVELAALVAAIIKGSGDSNRTEGIESVGILDNI